MFILDTDHITAMEWSTSPSQQNLLRRLSTVSPQSVFTTIVTYEEQARGWMAQAARARTTAQQVSAYRKLQRHLGLYRRVMVLGFDEDAGVNYDRLRASRVRIGTMDLKIAAIALAHDTTGLTRNMKDFGRVPGLRAED